MAHPARILAAALLATALAVPASLHASALLSLSPDARPSAGMSLRIDSWSLDWLFRLVNLVSPKTGPGLDPSGGTGTDTGPGLDPSGRAPVRRHAAAKDSTPDNGPNLDPSGGRAHSRFSSGRPRL
jgi:hypothetical protein